jgi:hypothetical protein
LFQHRHLALASLIITALFAAPAAHAGEKDFHPAPPEIDLPAAALPPVALASDEMPVVASLAEKLPDEPLAALQQDTTNQQQDPAVQPPPPQTVPGWGKQPTGPISSDEQLKIQEQQRVFGVMAAFNTTVNHDALPLSPGQKFQLFFKSQTDPWPFGLAAVIAGFNQAQNTPPEYGQGMQGYGKRLGASYTDSFIGNFWGNAVLTSWWHEDPRYFQKGTGSFGSRFLWATTATVWCKRDSGTWGPNYANVAGNLIGAAIANVYYPQSERTVHDTIARGLSVTAQGIIGAEVIEFWPDMVRHYRRKQAEKLARQAAQQNSQAAQVHQNSSAPAGDPKP